MARGRAVPFFSITVLVACFLLLFAAEPTSARIQLPANESIPAIFVFGDSILDTGNNNGLLASPCRSNFPPYGRAFDGGVPTGRFSDGRVPSDFMVEELGIKDTLPAYKDPNLKLEELLTGVNFASGCVGFDDLASKLGMVPPLSQQLREFNDYVNKVKEMIGEEAMAKLLAKSIVIISLCSNDIVQAYFNSHIRELQYDFSTYADILVKSATTFLMELYSIGCRRIGMFGAPPLGCIPFIRTMTGGVERMCSERHNQASQLYNSKLISSMNSLQSSRNLDPGARLVYLDLYDPMMHLIVNYRSYGFEVADKGCCGMGQVEMSVLCNKYNPYTCTDGSKYVFWDSYHPTEKTYKLLVSQCLASYLHNFL
ncbi:unnamed protein product [Linum trigynum]|uniref:GDSL esterase/lipase EXL3 n=1 Tax=Linum trigynum TaxID=586398 RepID=A0AAV2CH60_9ROSI